MSRRGGRMSAGVREAHSISPQLHKLVHSSTYNEPYHSSLLPSSSLFLASHSIIFPSRPSPPPSLSSYCEPPPLCFATTPTSLLHPFPPPTFYSLVHPPPSLLPPACSLLSVAPPYPSPPILLSPLIVRRLPLPSFPPLLSFLLFVSPPSSLSPPRCLPSDLLSFSVTNFYECHRDFILFLYFG